jgi:septum formation topological specificity factor MinE
MREEEFDKIITSISKHVAIDKEKVKMSGYLN